MNMDFLSKIRSTIEGLFGGNPNSTQATLSPVHVTRPPQPTPTQQPQQPMGPPNPSPQPTAAPGIDNAMQFIQGQMPPSSTQTPQEYYPALGNPEFMAKIQELDKLRQGLAGLELLQGFFESGLGRATNGNNIFGALPGGQGAGTPAGFQSPVDSLNYQNSPAVLGGGANPNMNILSQNTPLTPQSVTQLYDSYNPNSPYLDTMLRALFPQSKGR